MEINEAKQSLRREIAKQKQLLTPELREQYSRQIMQRIEEHIFFKKAQCVALYCAIQGEVETTELIDKWYKTKQILLPVVTGDHLLLQPYIGKEALQKSSMGIMEPLVSKSPTNLTPDLLIVPGIAFDKALNRLGRGKGYYDRLLSDKSIPTIGICFHFQLRDHIPADAHDRKMTAIITEQEIIC